MEPHFSIYVCQQRVYIYLHVCMCVYNSCSSSATERVQIVRRTRLKHRMLKLHLTPPLFQSDPEEWTRIEHIQLVNLFLGGTGEEHYLGPTLPIWYVFMRFSFPRGWLAWWWSIVCGCFCVLCLLLLLFFILIILRASKIHHVAGQGWRTWSL